MSKKKGARQRFKKRKSYLRWLGIFMILGFLILASPIYTHKKVDIPDEVSTNAFLNTKELTMVSKEKGANQQLVFEFAIDDEDQSSLKELANLNYRVEVKTAKGDYQAIKAKVIKVSNDYFAVKLSHVPEEYIAMRLTIIPEKIDPKVDMQEPQDLIYYVHEDKVKDQVKDEVKDEDYEQHAMNYKVKGYKKEQKAAQKQIESFQATIDLNEELVKKLKDQLPYQVADDQENTENKINSYQQEIETSKTQMKDQEEIIQKLQEKIDRMTKENI
ncbi:hypothetical protein [Enterococcus lactis]|uniref:hypothetical protein n=1 Tax=Enterococcus lactis TaxID=357441 RepID=UPI0012E271BB|nr:hypothetical protein [Enterococcus lactis]MUP35779.1 hypothetical protein [Enterococcus lactis]QXM04988.1 hypothetical protein KVG00_12405 [Enterococcus lactis]